MRQAGTIATRQDAERFADYLLSLGISSKLERAADQWAIWIHDENQVSRSRQELEQFQLEPGDARYHAAEQVARQARREAADRQRQVQKNYVDMREVWDSPWRRRPVTLVMIGISVALALNVLDVSKGEFLFNLPLIWEGEVWRLITPIFLHADLQSNPLHLVFNMWWLYDLGTLIERRLGSLRFAALVLVIALASNIGQYIASGPNFIGMSGVVFGLFGYAWVRGRLDPSSGMYLQRQVVVLMIAWLFACMIIREFNVANTAHAVGLAAGAVLGYLPHLAGRLLGK